MKELLQRNLKINCLDGTWYFKNGMEFGNEYLWWGECKKRLVPHEGIDLGYVEKNSEIIQVPPNFIIHNFIKGTVVRVIDDFIGKSVFIKHSKTIDKKELFSIYGHIEANIKSESLKSFDDIGRIASKKGIPRHYHYSLALIPCNIENEMLDWKIINSIRQVEFINPINYIYQE